MQRATEFSDDDKETKMVDKTLNELFLAQLKDIYLRGEEDLSVTSQNGEGDHRS